MAEIKVVKLGDVSYELNGKYIQDASGNPKSWSDIVALANSSKLELKVVESLPTASADTMSYIYLVASASATTIFFFASASATCTSLAAFCAN